MEMITSTENNRIKQFASLRNKKYRERYGLFIVEERHMIMEAIRARAVDTLIIREGVENPFDMDGLYVSSNVMRKLSENESLNDFVAVCHQIDGEPGEMSRVIVLEAVQDPGNVGTIIRTAHCFGYDAVLLDEKCADLYNSKTISATQGALFHIPVYRFKINKIFDIIKDNHLSAYGTALNDTEIMSDIEPEQRYALIFGNEGQGLSEFARSKCDKLIKIAMDNFDSLNVSSAMAICSYYFRYHD